MLTQIANIHRSKLPRVGHVVTVNDRPLQPGHRRRRFEVMAYPLTDSADYHYSVGVHTCIVRALDNGQEFRVSGFWCEEED